MTLQAFLPPASLQRGTLFNLYSEKRTRGKKPFPLLHLFYFITSLLGKLGQLCSLAYLFTFSLQDYIGIIIVFYGAFFWCFTLFEGPVDLGRWRKMDPFWGIRLLRDKMQLHTGSFFFSTLFSSRCQSLGMLDIRAGMMLKQTQHNGKIISSYTVKPETAK